MVLILSLVYQKFSGVFGSEVLSVADQTLAEGTNIIQFYLSWDAMVFGFIFLLLSLVLVALGELQLSRNEFLAEEDWSSHFEYQNQDAYFIQRYDGICNQQKDGTYRIKYNVYGYDEAMIEQLNDFILEGEIRSEEIKNSNQVIVTANMDGQGTEKLSQPAADILFQYRSDPADHQPVPYYEQHEPHHSYEKEGIRHYPGNGDH